MAAKYLGLFLLAISPLWAGQSDKKTANKPNKKIKRLVAQLSSQDKDSQTMAMIRLGKLGPKAAPAIPKLIQFFYQSDDFLRYNAIDTLGLIGKPCLYRILGLLSDPRPKIQESAAMTLGKMGKPALRYLKLALKGRDPFLRKYAARALGLMNMKKKEPLPLLPDLIRLFQKDGDIKIRCEAAISIGKMGPPAKKAIPVFLAHLKAPKDPKVKKGDDLRLRASVISALAFLGKPAVTPLIQELHQENGALRTAVAAALGGMGKKVVPLLIPLLSDKDWKAREGGALALRWLGKKAVTAIPFLISNLNDGDKSVRKASARALGAIGKKAFPPLMEILQKKNIRLKEGASLALMYMKDLGKVSKKNLYTLVSFFYFASPKVKGHIARAFKNMGPQALPVLVKTFKSRDSLVREYVIFSLGEMGEGAVPAYPTLMDALKDKAVGVRDTAIEALAKIGKPILAQMIVSLKDPQPKVRYGVVLALGKMGPSAKKALPAVINALKDPDKTVWKAARQALKKIKK